MTASRASTERVHQACYVMVFETLDRAGVEFLVGGAFALNGYVAHWRPTKDLDVFLRPADVAPGLAALEAAGFEVELTNPRWLAKARRAGSLTDLIFCSYNGLLPVDTSWFVNGRPGRIFGVPVRLVGPEEMIVSKSFVAARDRFDGSDIAWMIASYGRELDWARIEAMFGEHWQVLYWQLVHFLYIFPGRRDQVPAALLEDMNRRFLEEAIGGAGETPGGEDVCRGSMLDPQSYRRTVGRRGARRTDAQTPPTHVVRLGDVKLRSSE